MKTSPINATVTEVHWIACKDQLPDDDLTVMIFSPGADQDVFMGWRSGGQWFDCYCHDLPVRAQVRAWANLPEGPK